MANHVHLLVKESNTDISILMKRFGVSYGYWYNWKYERRGHLFQDRFKSECIEDDAYLLTVIRYIHNNPVKAAIVHKPEQYRWSKKAYLQALQRKQLLDFNEFGAVFCCFNKKGGPGYIAASSPYVV